VVDLAGIVGGYRQDVPVERPTRRPAHAGEQLDLLVAEPAEAPLHDGLQRRALEVGDDLAQGQDLVLRRVAARHRFAVAVDVRGRPGGGQAQPAGRQRLPQEPPDLLQLRGR
jgi:hypothetical protein